MVSYVSTSSWTESIGINNYPTFVLVQTNKSVWKEVGSYDTCQRTKQPTIKYGKFPVNSTEEIPCNKFCVYLLGPYIIHRKGNNK